MINTYETIFICSGDLPQEKVDAALEKVKTVIARSAGTVNTAEQWGKRRLAYTVRRNREGYYVYMIFSGPTTLPSLLNQHYRVTDTILRGLTVKVDPRHLEKIRPVVKSVAETVPAASAGTVVSSENSVAVAPADKPAAEASNTGMPSQAQAAQS